MIELNISDTFNATLNASFAEEGEEVDTATVLLAIERLDAHISAAPEVPQWAIVALALLSMVSLCLLVQTTFAIVIIPCWVINKRFGALEERAPLTREIAVERTRQPGKGKERAEVDDAL